jgi:hypothetical protein
MSQQANSAEQSFLTPADNLQSEHEDLVEISWEELFRQFEDSNLALRYEEHSLFSKLVGRDSLPERTKRARSRAEEKRQRELPPNHGASSRKTAAKNPRAKKRGHQGTKN